MKKNGFMVYELVISFVLAFAILLVIFNTTLTLSQRLTNLYAKNQLTSKQIILNKKIGYDFMTMDVDEITRSGLSWTIKYTNETDETEKKLNIGISNDRPYIEYGAEGELERILFDEGTIIGLLEHNTRTEYPSNYILHHIKIPITYGDNPIDYGIELFDLVY